MKKLGLLGQYGIMDAYISNMISAVISALQE